MTNKAFVILFLGLLFSFKTNATTFQLMPLDKLVEESGSAAEVQLKEKKSYMNKMGMIYTDFIFTVGESYNVDGGDLEGDNLKITMTGGTVNGVTSFIDNAPDFTVGEKSFLLLNRIESKMYISNFTMGKYKIEEHDGKTFYISSVFPNDPDMGRVPKERMIETVKTKFKITQDDHDPYIPVIPAFKKVQRNGVVHFEKRAPAQEDVDPREAEDGQVAMWAFFALMLTSGTTMWWKLRKGVRP